MSKSTLLTLGCSWTDRSWYQYNDVEYFPQWPDIVSNYFDLNVLNLGQGGRGNSHMLNKLTDALHDKNNNISIVMILWSGQDRINTVTNSKWSWNLSDVFHGTDWKHYNTSKKVQFDHSAWILSELIYTDGKYMSEEFLRTVYQAQKICGNMPMICMSAFNPIGKHLFRKERLETINKSKYLHLNKIIEMYLPQQAEESWKKYLQSFLDCSYYDWIEDNVNFLGFPVYPELGGWDVTTGLYKDYESRTEGKKSPYRISIDDPHPNAKGQEVIADEFIKAYKEILS